MLSLTAGIGGTVSMFTVVNSIVLRPLTYGDPGRLVRVMDAIPKDFGTNPGLHPLEFRRWRHRVQSFESIALLGLATSYNLTGSGEPETVGAMRISAEFFETLKVRPQLGRWFQESDEQRGMPNVVIVSDSLWRRRFSRDAGIVGTKIVLNGAPHEVVGVAPSDLKLLRGKQLHPGIDMPERSDVFVPIRFSTREEQGDIYTADYVAIARLKTGVTADQAQAELDATLPTISEYQVLFTKLRTHTLVQDLQSAVTVDVRKGLFLLLAAVGLVLLIACANVANLSLVRATKRSQELAVRAALGASRSDLIRHSLAESIWIALGGTAGGLLLSLWITDLAISRTPSQLPRLEEISANSTVFGFAVAMGAITTILFGLLPAWRVSRTDPLEALSASGRGKTDTVNSGRIRSAVIAAEVALGTVLVIGAGLLLASLHQVMSVPRGFDGHDVLTVDLLLPSPAYRPVEKQAAFFRSVHDGLMALPGVVHVAAAHRLPLTVENPFLVIAEGASKDFELPISTWLNVSGEYFAAMKIPLRAGRLFRDGGETEKVAVVSESAARSIWPGQDPIGRRVANPFAKDDFSRVVGIVGDVRSSGLDRAPVAAIYRPYEQRGGRPTAFGIVVQTEAAPQSLIGALREVVRHADPGVPVPEIRPMDALIERSVQPRVFQAALLSAFAMAAVVLAAIGVYGVVAYSMCQRRKEIGVRIALGAEKQDISRLVFQNAMTPVAAGLAAGLLGACVFARLMTSLLFQVRALDPIAFTVAPLVLVLAAAAPCWLTSRHAARIDPVDALRLE